MQPYPEYLRQLIDSRRVAIYALAAESGIDRTLIHKMLKGQRVPSDPGVVRSLSAALMLTPEESDGLFESYLAAKMGEKIYTRRKSILDFYNQFDSFPVKSRVRQKKMATVDLPSENKTVYGKLDVQLLAASVLEREAAKPNGRIRIMAQPECGFFDLLSVVGAQNSTLSIEHILCFENSQQECSALYNLGCLRAMMPVFASVCQYRPQCYYGSISNRFGETSIMPCLILTEDCVMQIAHDASFASFSVSAQDRDLYGRIFQKFVEKSTSLVAAFHSPFEEIEYLNRAYAEYDYLVHDFTSDPCLLPFAGEEMMFRYMDPSFRKDEARLRLLQEYMKFPYVNGNFANTGNIYFSEEGVDRFLTTGRLSEVPAEYYSPIEIPDRFRLLRSMYEASAAKKYHPVLANAKKMRIPFSLSTYLLRRGAVCFVYTVPDRTYTALFVTEPSIVLAVQDFLNYLPESDLVLSTQETLRYLKKALGRAPRGGDIPATAQAESSG